MPLWPRLVSTDDFAAGRRSGASVSGNGSRRRYDIGNWRARDRKEPDLIRPDPATATAAAAASAQIR